MKLRMTKKEYEKRKAELRSKIENATEAELAELRKEVDKLKDVEIVEDKAENEPTDERALLNGAIDRLEQRNRGLDFSNEREIEKIQNDEERNAEETSILDTPEYRSAFLKRLQGKELTAKEKRAMTTATDSVGAAIPTTTLNRIETMLRQTSALYNRVDVLNIPGYLSIPVESTVNDASWVEEGKASTDVKDTLTTVNFAAYKLIRTISITAEVASMTISAFETWIVKKLSDKMAIAIENAILNGTGSNQPKGVLLEDITKLTSENSDKFTYDDICKIMSELKAGYKRDAAFVVNTKTLWLDLASIKVGDKLLFIPDPTGEFPGRIFGKPVIEDEYIEEGKILLGSFNKYTINWNKPVNITSDDSTEFRSGDRVYRGMGLVDGKTVNKEAFVLMTKKATPQV